MVDAMGKEMEMRARSIENWPSFNTLYFGGGTPSILNDSQLSFLFYQAGKVFGFNKLKEITLEANPDDMSEAKLKFWKNLGINRLSIGVQTFNNNKLEWMNRNHNADQARFAISKAQDIGFENLSIDLMYNLPGVSLKELENDFKIISALKPNHISAYSLTIEKETVFGNWLKKGKLEIIPEEEAASQFQFLMDLMMEAGFEQYEISNFSIPGHEAIHNTAYWFQKPYLGIGPGAHGFDGIRKRYVNKPNNALYIKSVIGEDNLHEENENLSENERANEMILTRLRTKWGLNLPEIKIKTGIDFKSLKKAEIEKISKENLLFKENQTLYLTKKGKLFADHIASKLFLD
jgi:oxygen-independent coproporphyrinogen-3 oxidase